MVSEFPHQVVNLGSRSTEVWRQEDVVAVARSSREDDLHRWVAGDFLVDEDAGCGLEPYANALSAADVVRGSSEWHLEVDAMLPCERDECLVDCRVGIFGEEYCALQAKRVAPIQEVVLGLDEYLLPDPQEGRSFDDRPKAGSVNVVELVRDRSHGLVLPVPLQQLLPRWRAFCRNSYLHELSF